MEIEGTTFGTITIDGKTYDHDVIIRLSGDVTGCDDPRIDGGSHGWKKKGVFRPPLFFAWHRASERRLAMVVVGVIG
ncbi:MAG TPA: hypothetical protein VH397_20355, partial [Xanthobacteraceae bacterium]